MVEPPQAIAADHGLNGGRVCYLPFAPSQNSEGYNNRKGGLDLGWGVRKAYMVLWSGVPKLLAMFGVPVCS